MIDIAPIYIGWDSREAVAFDVCAYSLWRRTTVPLMIMPLRERDLRHMKIYWREHDPLASTEFTYTRFLTPWLARRAGFTDWALFCDGDFLWLRDVQLLWDLFDPKYAVMCVKHDHVPAEAVKMDGAAQTVYPRKNWSSLMAFNLAHPAVKELTIDAVNTMTPAELHQFKWVPDDLIGALPESWNWLEGHSTLKHPPDAIHFTRGGPWFQQWQKVFGAKIWETERAIMDAQLKSRRPSVAGLPVMEAD